MTLLRSKAILSMFTGTCELSYSSSYPRKAMIYQIECKHCTRHCPHLVTHIDSSVMSKHPLGKRLWLIQPVKDFTDQNTKATSRVYSPISTGEAVCLLITKSKSLLNARMYVVGL